MGGGSHTSAAKIPRMCFSRSPHTSSPQWAVSVVGPIQEKKKVGAAGGNNPQGSSQRCFWLLNGMWEKEEISQLGSSQGRLGSKETPKLRINFRT